MKSYTDLNQSKVLTKILPPESADMRWLKIYDDDSFDGSWEVVSKDSSLIAVDDKLLFCWSLTALLGVLPNYQLQTQDDGIGILCSYKGEFSIITADNPIDACVAMIEYLHKINLL